MKTVTKKTTSKKASFNTNKKDIFIAKIIEMMNQLEDENWQTFHKVETGIPINGITKKSYNGSNTFILMLDLLFNKYALNSYLTFKKISELGGIIRKGSKGVPIEFFTINIKHKTSFKTITEQEYKTLTKDEQENYKVNFIVKNYFVFNLSCVENYDEFSLNLEKAIEDNYTNVVEEKNDFEQIVQNLKTEKGLIINEILQGRAFYSPTNDEVSIPKKNLFKSTEVYYSTLFHELTHWTGHPTRLNRSLQGMNDIKNYAFEELIAELGNLLFHFDFGKTEPLVNSLIYLKGWLKHTEDANEETLRKAFSEAKKACNFLLK